MPTQQSLFSDGPGSNMYASASRQASRFPDPIGVSPNAKFWEELVSGSIAGRINEAASDKTLGSSVEVYNVLKPIFAQEPDVERMLGVYMSRKNTIIAIETIARGSLTGASVYPREIIKAVLHHKASSLVISHNHPSGDPAPSPEDLNITKHIVFALYCVGANLLDHVVIGNNGAHYSFGDDGLLIKMRQQAAETFKF